MAITLHCIALHCIALHCIALHCIALHCIASVSIHVYTLGMTWYMTLAWHGNNIALHCLALHCIALHCIALHCIALHCIALHCIALHCIALHCIALHCIALHSVVYTRFLLMQYCPSNGGHNGPLLFDDRFQTCPRYLGLLLGLLSGNKYTWH